MEAEYKYIDFFVHVILHGGNQLNFPQFLNFVFVLMDEWTGISVTTLWWNYVSKYSAH
jgi:hypothetical protein